MGDFCGPALFCRRWADSRGNPVLDDPGRVDADAAPNAIDELLHRVRIGRRPTRLDDLGGTYGSPWLARSRYAWHRACVRRGFNMALCAGIGALAHRKGALCRGACGSRGASWHTAAVGALADHSSCCSTARAPLGALSEPADVLGDDPDLGRLFDSGLWCLFVGSDDCRDGAECSRSTSRQILYLCCSWRSRRKDCRDLPRAAHGPASAWRSL